MKVTCYRRQLGEHQWKMLGFKDVERPFDDVFKGFVKYEIGFGGKIVSYDKTSCVCITPIMHKEDKTLYYGTEKEIETFVLTSMFFEEQCGIGTEEYIDNVMRLTNGQPLMITCSFAFILGQMRLEKGLDLVKGLNNER